MPDEPATIIVAGTGPAGLTAALGLADAGFQVNLVGPAANRADARTTALMTPALAYLDTLGALARFRAEAAPLRVMRIVDVTQRLIRSATVTFHAAEIDEDYFGLNIPNSVLNGALEDAVLAATGIRWHREFVESWSLSDSGATATLAGGTQLSASLAVAADGRLSAARLAAGIRTIARPFPQSALVVSFTHSRPHASISTEFHTETGPFTQVPLPGDRSSLVWVVEPHTAETLAALGPVALSDEIERRMQSMLGKVTVDSPVQVYPLGVTLPMTFAKNRVALVGEAAHTFPPIGAQGLNLGIRDVQQLVEIARANADDPGAPSALAAFDARRRPDILARTGAVSLLNRSLLSSMLPAQIARSAGLGLLGAFAPLRALFMREGLRPGSGLSSLVASTRKEVRR